jgi:hypothetical protein
MFGLLTQHSKNSYDTAKQMSSLSTENLFAEDISVKKHYENTLIFSNIAIALLISTGIAATTSIILLILDTRTVSPSNNKPPRDAQIGRLYQIWEYPM